jgi:hypothetical protein
MKQPEPREFRSIAEFSDYYFPNSATASQIRELKDNPDLAGSEMADRTLSMLNPRSKKSK